MNSERSCRDCSCNYSNLPIYGSNGKSNPIVSPIPSTVIPPMFLNRKPLPRNNISVNQPQSDIWMMRNSGR